ncbi:MAG: peptidase [Lachnospiraceae bacterium]|nr:peptidase [Lachnospiraceae bacterium]
MKCQNMIYSNDYADYIINSNDLIIEGNENNCCTNTIMERMAIQHCPQKEQRLTNLESVPYSFIPKLYGLMDSGNMEVTGVKQVQKPETLALSGRGIIVGIIDTGIDFTNPLFINGEGNSRVGMMWDQSIPCNETCLSGVGNEMPSPFYGTVYDNMTINKALASSNPYDIVPSKDDDGHGTYMAGIISGNIAADKDFVGIAYEAEIAVVKVKECKPYLKEYFGVRRDAKAYQETDIIYAVAYLLQYSRYKRMPISIYIGMGSSNGGHLGYTFLERYLDSVLENIATLISVPAGNEGNERLHYAGEIPDDAEVDVVEVNVGQGQDSLVIELWGNAPTTFAVGIDAPGGERIERIVPRFGSEELVAFPITRTTVYVVYQLVEVYSGDELIFIRLTAPTPGIWRFRVYADEGRQRTYNMWMPLRQFLQPDTYFLRPEPENTVTNPGNARLVMTMTAYNHINESLYAKAGRGYTARNVVKPSLAAPGVNVYGPGLNQSFVTRTGTSVAAAHSAGMLALFLQWNMNNLEFGFFFAEQIESFFFRSATREEDYEYPNILWGYGIMNIWNVFERFRIVELPKL